MFEHWQKVCCFITRKCNLKCRGCNVINHQTQTEMSTQEWFRAFSILKERGVGFVVLFGGEPTLNDELPAMVSYLNSIDMPHTIITNGVRLSKDIAFYKRLIAAKPYGISTSVNVLEAKDSFHDSTKSEAGANLLAKLKLDLPECDLVANMAVTRKNILDLPNLVQHFTDMDIWSILSFFHVAPVSESLYWWYRGPATEENEELVFKDTLDDRILVERISRIFVQNYDKMKLHNQKAYFEVWTKYGITQDWHCHEWVCPAINPDGSLMACIDRPLTKPWSIFDLGKNKPEIDMQIYDSFKKTIYDCDRGCLWDHMWETNKYASENNSDEGKKRFAHRGEA